MSTKRSVKVIESKATSEPPELTDDEDDFNRYLEELAAEGAGTGETATDETATDEIAKHAKPDETAKPAKSDETAKPAKPAKTSAVAKPAVARLVKQNAADTAEKKS